MATATNERAAVLVRMPRKLKDRIAKDAFGSGSNLTSVIVGVLSEHYGVKYEAPAGRRSVPFGGGHRNRQKK